MKYNREPFHIQHGLTVSCVLKWFASELGYENEAEYWAMVGLLHDIDFEMYPEEHCQRAPAMLREAGIGEDMIRSICSHGYGVCSDIEPQHFMEKILFAADELTGLISATILMRPSKSTQDLGLKSLKKKYKDKSFAAGCSRETMAKGAEMLGWTVDELMEKTILAMRACEETVRERMGTLGLT